MTTSNNEDHLQDKGLRIAGERIGWHLAQNDTPNGPTLLVMTTMLLISQGVPPLKAVDQAVKNLIEEGYGMFFTGPIK